MCDFRGPPKAIRDRVTGTEVETPYRGHIYPESKPFITGIDKAGIYGFVATGSYYQYYNGNRWFSEYYEYKDWKNDGVDFIHDLNTNETHEHCCLNYIKDDDIYEIKDDPNGYKMVLVVGKK